MRVLALPAFVHVAFLWRVNRLQQAALGVSTGDLTADFLERFRAACRGGGRCQGGGGRVIPWCLSRGRTRGGAGVAPDWPPRHAQVRRRSGGVSKTGSWSRRWSNKYLSNSWNVWCLLHKHCEMRLFVRPRPVTMVIRFPSQKFCIIINRQCCKVTKNKYFCKYSDSDTILFCTRHM